MKKRIILIIAIIFCFNSIVVYGKDYIYKNKVYQRNYIDKDDVRYLNDIDNYYKGDIMNYFENYIRVNFYQIDYLEDKALEKEINYLLEKFSFETIYKELKGFYKLYTDKDIQFKDVLYWIDNLENEEFRLYILSKLNGDDIFKLGYIDENIINIYYTMSINGFGFINEKKSDSYGKYDVTAIEDKGSFILDINKKEEIKLTDVIELDKRLLEYKIGDGITDYNTETVIQYKSFKDAFEIYTNDKEKDNDHDRTLDEVIEELKNNEHTWYLDEDKNLTFILYIPPKHYTEFKIDYEFIKPLLKDKYKYL